MEANLKCIGDCPVIVEDLEAVRNSSGIINTFAQEDYRRHCDQSIQCTGSEIIVRNGSVIKNCPLFDVKVQFTNDFEF